jgi:hypothetical protein
MMLLALRLVYLHELLRLPYPVLLSSSVPFCISNTTCNNLLLVLVLAWVLVSVGVIWDTGTTRALLQVLNAHVDGGIVGCNNHIYG